MNYQESINYIEGLAVFGSKPGFERINALLDALDHPEKGMKYIHVAGTNGKGSICTTVANILTEAGYKTGLFTSPFVSDFRERIQINGAYISKEALCKNTEIVRNISEKLAEKGIQPTEFEVITAIMFLFFKEEKCDIVVLEVGLGGLLDSTNVIDKALVSAITSLSFDHMGILGNTIDEIAAHKAGIIKDGGITISAPHQPESALQVLRTVAYEHQNKFVIADPGKLKVLNKSILGTEIEYRNIKMNLHLIGPHQVDNLSVSLTIVDELIEAGMNISDDSIKSGVEKTVVPARIEIVSSEPLIIIDGGHNEDGARVLSETLKEFTHDKNKILVMGVMADKEVDKVLRCLAPIASKVITTTPQSPRSMEACQLCEKAKEYCSDVAFSDDPCKAYELAKKISTTNDCIVVCGSLYLAGDVRNYILDTLK